MMELCPLVTGVLLLLSCLVSAAFSHSEFVHAGELINRENVRTSLESSVRLLVSPNKYLTSGDWVKLSWRYINSPSNYDWIGLYSPPLDDIYRINPVTHAPIKVQYANVSDDHLIRGRGRVYFKVMNMRHPVVFGFFRGGFDNPTLVAISSTLHFWNYNMPMQGHLALTGNPTTMAIQWSTLNMKVPAVYYGTKSGSYKYFKTASTATYDASMMCNSPASDFGWREPGLLHTAVLENLTPGQRYYYVYGDYYGWSSEKSFKAAPSSKMDVKSTLITFGDMGCGEEDGSFFLLNNIQPESFNTTHMILQQMDRGSVDFILHLGDLSYARGFSAVWDIFFNQIEPIATRLPYMVAMGNFERNTPPLPKRQLFKKNFVNTENSATTNVTLSGTEPKGECGVPFNYRFPMPKSAIDQPWYSFSYGKAHFIIMSTEHDFERDSAQYKAISKSLRKVDRSVTPWVIVGGHRPMYVASTNADHLSVAEHLRAHIEPLLKVYKVDLALWAHHHSYQRTCHVFREQCRTPDRAPVHVVVGVGGQDISLNLIPEEDPLWIKAVDYYHHGFSKITYNSTTLEFQFIRHLKNEVFDSFVLRKGAEGSGSLSEEVTEHILSPLDL